MDPTLGFNEQSVNASETSFVYDKVRQAELQENYWVFATKRACLRAVDTTTMLVSPALWSSTATYFRGSIVADQSGNLWESAIGDNLNNDPLLTNYWTPYFGPMAVQPFDTTGATTYFSDELVYTYTGDGTYRVYRSLITGNTDVPGTATAWASTTTYYKDQVVTFNSVAYLSLIDLNLNNEPDLTSPALWSSLTTYAIGNKVRASDGFTYTSSANGNLNNNPITDNGVHWTKGSLAAWTTSFVGGTGSLNWLEIGGAEFPNGVGLTSLNVIYPVGAGPSSQVWSRNVFLLPANFLRLAPQNPKSSTIPLGGPSGYTYNDWNIENGYLVSAETGAIILRFVADVQDVHLMDAMFCEGLAARIGFEVWPKIGQTTTKRSEIAQAYVKAITRAKTSNAIEAGYDDPPDDDFLAVRA